MANSILVNAPMQREGRKSQPTTELVTWLQERADTWEDYRNRAYALRWAEYYRLWRGRWHSADKSRQSERSKIIAPALSQAIEMTVAEMESSIFGRDIWFDVEDNLEDQDKVDAMMARDQLREDLENAGVKGKLAEIFLNGALYGTGIGKVNTDVMRIGRVERNLDTMKLEKVEDETVKVSLEAVRPEDFIPDPAGRTIDEMLGAFHKISRPMHAVLEKIAQGTYMDSALDSLVPSSQTEQADIDEKGDLEPEINSHDSDVVVVYEYHGKVPLRFMRGTSPQVAPELKALEAAVVDSEAKEPKADDRTQMVEVIVTFTEEGTLLRSIVNPNVMADRAFIAWQFEPVPGRFWGRGVAEKGYNPQKALDAEMRMRIDALAYVAAPMMGMDAGRIDRTMDFTTYPGKVWLTIGNPQETLFPLSFGNINANTFNQTAELERMVQSATGAMAGDVQSQLNASRSTATGSSLLMSTFVKRSQRAIQSVDRELISPFIKKAMWRFMQFDAARYPRDFNFVTKSVAGMAARELEAHGLQQTMAMMPQDGFANVKLSMVRGIVDNTTLPNKAQILQQIDAELNPTPEQQAEQKQLKDMQMAKMVAELQEQQAKAQKAAMEAFKAQAEGIAALQQAGVQVSEAQVNRLFEMARIGIEQQEVEQFAVQNALTAENLKIKREEVAVKRIAANKKGASK